VAARIGRAGGPEAWSAAGAAAAVFSQVGLWLQAGKYVAAVASDVPKRNGWTIAQPATSTSSTSPGERSRAGVALASTRLAGVPFQGDTDIHPPLRRSVTSAQGDVRSPG